MIDTKYDEIIESNILAKKIKMKINEYNSLENEYNDLLKKEIAKKKKIYWWLGKNKRRVN